ncbi:class I SAM-dependent methyltransferase [Hyalangium sp.]|uniref:class I SAM-dependent methyltransferase n=1 Tax=Hyalangium sp. TaxID=2028555 RepID=UPI002D37EE7C|nr:class I SAM-dependent methyltransferase [Hyalangium sp.]HYH96753.1 class I SAM-dependent methyltransferase [Hyalangium sp.]
MSSLTETTLKLFSVLPPAERFHVRARALSAPLEAVAWRVPRGAVVAEVGCGHGLLSAMIATEDRSRTVYAVDPDPRKVKWAEEAAGGLPNVHFEVATVERLVAQRPGGFDAAVVSDVLYLLPREQWPEFLRSVRALLHLGGRFLLKEAEGNRSWKHYKCLAQEWVMVKLLGRTKAGGGLVLEPQDTVVALLQEAGFKLREVVELDKGYTTPHILYVAEAA